jgi:hypothetical protein
MAFDKDKIYKQALKAIEENHLYFIDDIVAYLPCQRSTFYEFFNAQSDEMDNIKEKLYQNKIQTKVEIRSKLSKGERAAELLSLYKLIATEDERRSLSQAYQEHSGEIKGTNEVKLTPDQLTEVIESLKPDEG